VFGEGCNEKLITSECSCHSSDQSHNCCLLPHPQSVPVSLYNKHLLLTTPSTQ